MKTKVMKNILQNILLKKEKAVMRMKKNALYI